MSVETTAPALDRFLETSCVQARLAVMPVLHREMARAAATFEPVLSLLEADKALADFLRHAACSAYFGGRNLHCPLAEVLARLGVAEFYRLVGTAVIHTRLASGAAPAFVAHADQVARLCEGIAGHCVRDLAVEAYFAGLCHDAAVPVMCESLTDYQYFAEQALGNDPGVLELERECHGFNHGEAGAAIVTSMGFSSAVAAAVRYHHEPTKLLDVTGDAARLLAILTIAERVIAVSKEQSVSVFVEAAEGEVQQTCWQALKLDRDRFQTVTAQMLELCRQRRKQP